MSIKSWIAKFKKEQAENEMQKLKNDFREVLRERDTAKAELRGTKDQLEDVKLKKKIEEEDIKHMVKIKEEKLDIEHQKKIIELERKKESEVATVKDQYRDRIEKNLEKQLGDMKSMYSEILQRLPNISVKMKGEV